MKNPHWTPAQEEQIALAERLTTRATICELGCAEFLKNHMPCSDALEEIRDVLASAVALRKRSTDIHQSLRPLRRSGKSRPSSKVLSIKKAKTKE